MRIVEGRELAVEVQPSLVVGGPGEGEPFAAEDPTEHADGQEESAPTVDPARAVGGESAGRYETVRVGMVQRRLPRCAGWRASRAGAEMARIRRHFEERLGGRPEQQAIERARILERERRERMRQGENHVRIGDRQKRGPLPLEPVCRGRSLAFRAVAVPARILRMTRCPHVSHASTWPPSAAVLPASKQTLDDALLIGAPGAYAHRTPPPRLRTSADLVSRSGSLPAADGRVHRQVQGA